MARDSCLARVTAGVAVGGAVGGAVGNFSPLKPQYIADSVKPLFHGCFSTNIALDIVASFSDYPFVFLVFCCLFMGLCFFNH